jgi:hypothetical protein
MGLYPESTTNEEDIAFVQEILDGKCAFYTNVKVTDEGVVATSDEAKVVLFLKTDTPGPPGYPDIIESPWGRGRLTYDGAHYVTRRVISQGRYTSSLENHIR